MSETRKSQYYLVFTMLYRRTKVGEIGNPTKQPESHFRFKVHENIFVGVFLQISAASICVGLISTEFKASMVQSIGIRGLLIPTNGWSSDGHGRSIVIPSVLQLGAVTDWKKNKQRVCMVHFVYTHGPPSPPPTIRITSVRLKYC